MIFLRLQAYGRMCTAGKYEEFRGVEKSQHFRVFEKNRTYLRVPDTEFVFFVSICTHRATFDRVAGKSEFSRTCWNHCRQWISVQSFYLFAYSSDVFPRKCIKSWWECAIMWFLYVGRLLLQMNRLLEVKTPEDRSESSWSRVYTSFVGYVVLCFGRPLFEWRFVMIFMSFAMYLKVDKVLWDCFPGNVALFSTEA